MLKKIMIGAGLAAIIATSAMAQSYQPEVGSGSITPKEYSNSLKPGQGENAFAFVPGISHRHVHHTYDGDHHNHDLDRR